MCEIQAYDIKIVRGRAIMEEFLISYAPVSFAQFKIFMAETGYSASPGGAGSGPVVNVSHDDAVQFCAWAGVMLPTDQQWMKAICPDIFLPLVDVGSVEYEWTSDQHENRGYVLRKYNSFVFAAECSSQIGRNSNIRHPAFGFRVVATTL